MMFTRRSLEHEWFYSLKVLANFRSKRTDGGFSTLTIHRFNVSVAHTGATDKTRIRKRNIFLCTGGAYYVPYSCLLISNKFGNGGEQPSRANKFLYAPAPPTSSIWALKPPSRTLVHKTTYAPMIYTALSIMFWMRANPLLTLNSQVFWAPNGTCLSARCHFTGPKKLSNSRAQPPPTCPCNGYARIQNIMHGA